MAKTDLSYYSQLILDWYDENARDLPWRKYRTPYSTWISEVMLQQTQAITVIPYYEKFMRDFPDIKALSEAGIDDVLSHWAGLGYYSRAKNLKKGADYFTQLHNGMIPDNKSVLIKAPGIGQYIAGAILSMAFNQPEPAVDGNLIRVIARLFALMIVPGSSEALRTVQAKLREMMPCDRPGDFNEALMDIGAMICTPKSPTCDHCPLSQVCHSHQLGKETDFPLKKTATKVRIEERTIFIIFSENRIAVRRRPDHGLLGRLYEFPSIIGHCPEESCTDTLERHFGIQREHILSIRALENDSFKFSHLIWDMKAFQVDLNSSLINTEILSLRETEYSYGTELHPDIHQAPLQFYEIENAAGLAFPTALKTYKDYLFQAITEQKQSHASH